MPDYGTSQQQLLLMQQMELARLRQQAGQRPDQRNPAIDRAIEQHMEQEYERQLKSSRARYLQRKMIIPGAMASGAARTRGLDEMVRASAQKGVLSKVPGRLAPEELTQHILNVGGGAYLATSGLSNVFGIKRRAAQQQFEPQLGGLGKAERVVGNISALNRVAAQMRVAQMVAGNEMPRSVQGMMGLYGMGPQFFGSSAKEIAQHQALASAAGIGGQAVSQQMGAMAPSAMGGMANLATGMMPMIAAQMGLSIWKAHRVRKLKAQRTPGGEKAAKIADPIFNTLDEQANILAQRQAMKPGEGILYQALRFIGTQVAVNPLIYEEMAFIREERTKGKEGIKEEYGEAIEGEGERDTMTRILDFTTGALDKTLAKYDIGTQLFNFLSTGQLPRTLQQNLETVWEKQGLTKREVRSEAKSRGITMDQHRLGITTSRMLIDMAPNVQMQEVALLSGIFDTNRYILLETEMIRRGGFGVADTENREVEYRRSAMGRVWDAIKEGGATITNLPGINAIANILTLPFRMPAKVLGGLEKTMDFTSRMLVGGRTADILGSEEELQKAAGIYKSPQEAANEFLSQGLPTIQEDIRMLGAVRAQALINIYQVVAKHLELATGATHTYDEKPFSKEIKKGAWSMTAGKYLSEIGLEKQNQRDQDRMEIALEKSFKGSFSDIVQFLGQQVGMFGGRGESQLDRVRRAARYRGGLERLSFLRTEAAETFGPDELMQAAMFRQRGIRGRDVEEAQFFDPALERAMMVQRDIGPRAARFMGRGRGGLLSLLGGTAAGVGALTGGLGLLPMAILGALGMGVGAISPALVRARQTGEVFGEYEGGAEQFLGVRGKVKSEMPKEFIEKIESVVGKVDDDWYMNPANQVIIASILQSYTPADAKKGIFAIGKAAAVTPSRTISDLYHMLEVGELKEPLPVYLAGLDPDLAGAMGLEEGQVSFYTRRMTGTGGTSFGGFRPGGPKSAKERAAEKWGGTPEEIAEEIAVETDLGKVSPITGLPITKSKVGIAGISPITGLPIKGSPGTVARELAELKESEAEKEAIKRERDKMSLAERSHEIFKQLLGWSKKTAKAVTGSKKEGGFLSGLFNTLTKPLNVLGGMLPLVLGGTTALLALQDPETAKEFGTKAAVKTVERRMIKKAAEKGGTTVAQKGAVKVAQLGGMAASKVAGKVGEKLAIKELGEFGVKAAGKEAAEAAAKVGGKTGAKMIGKSALKKIPVLGALAGIGFGLKRLTEGDFTGAGLEIASGLMGGTGIGFVGSLGIDGYLALKDIEKAKKAAEGKLPTDQAPSTLQFNMAGTINQEKEGIDHTFGMPMMGYGGLATRPTIVAENYKPELVVPMTEPENTIFRRNFGDPKAIRTELAEKIDEIQQDNKLDQVAQDSMAPLLAAKATQPQIPIPMIETGEEYINEDKEFTPIDIKLDKFLNSLLVDCSFEFGNRYKRYVYDSNVGFSFA